MKGLAWGVLGCSVAFGAVLLASAIFDLSLLKRPLEAQLSRGLGRAVLINGPVHFRLSGYPRLVMRRVFVANGKGAAHPDLLLAGRVEARLGLAGLWPPRLRIRGLTIERAEINLDMLPDGPNWLLPSHRSRPFRLLGVPIEMAPSSVVLADTNVRLGAQSELRPAALVVQRGVVDVAGNGNGHALLFIRAVGLPLRLDADIAPAPALFDGHKFSLDARLTGPDSHLDLTGSAAFGRAGDLRLTAKGSAGDTRLLIGRSASAGAKTPASVTLKVLGTASAGTLQLDFAQLGQGDLAIAFNFHGSRRPVITGQVSAQHLDLRAILPGGRHMDPGQVVPDLRLALPWLRHVQIDAALAAPNLDWGEARLGRLTAHLAAANGILDLGDISLAGPNLSLSGDATLDERAVPRLSLSLKGHVSAGAPTLANANDAGQADFAIEMSGQGKDMREVLASAIGQSDILAGGVAASPALAKLVPSELSLGVAAQTVSEDPSPLKILCLLNRLDIAGGRATSRAFFLDTPGAVTTGEGAIDLASGAVDAHLAPRPKDPARLGDAADLTIGGTLADPLITRSDPHLGYGLLLGSGQIGMAQRLSGLMPLIDASKAGGNPCVKLLFRDGQVAAQNGAQPRKLAGAP